MKLIRVLLVAVVTINVTEAKSLRATISEKDIIESDVSKSLNFSVYDVTRRQGISLFPKRSHRKRDFVINLNPTMNTVRQSFELEKYRKPFMKKLTIKEINNKDNVKITAEVTTRSSLMQRKNYTGRPHDVYAKQVYNKYNGINRNTSTYNIEILKSKTNITKGKFQSSSEEKNSEEEAQNFNSEDMFIKDYDFVDFEKQNINNTPNIHDDIGLRKSKILLFFLKKIILNNSKNTLRLRSKNKTSSNVVNNQLSKVNIIEDRDNSTPEVTVKSDSRNQLDEVLVPEENISYQEKKDEGEYIYVQKLSQRVVSNAKRDVSGNGAMTNDQRFRFYTFMKHTLS